MRPSLLKSLYLPRHYCLTCQRAQATLSSSTSSTDSTKADLVVKNARDIPRGQIKIPKRKKRDSVAILQALSSTVQRDPAAPSYCYLDDPNLFPKTLMAKRSALLSKASGRRTARYMVNEYKEAFDHDAGVPHVESFQPKRLGYEFSEPSTEALLERIAQREVTDAKEVYNRMEDLGLEITTEVKLKLLELLCALGSQCLTRDLMPEESIIDDIKAERSKPMNKFNISFAEDLFSSLPEKTDDAYNWMTRLLLKTNYERGMSLYEEMVKSNIPVYLGSYNELIGSTITSIWPSILNYLELIKRDGLAPNMDTFHQCLKALNQQQKGRDRITSKITMILAEMRELGLEPTLTTWSLVLDLLDSEVSVKDKRGKKSGIMSDILDIVNYLQQQVDDDSIVMDSPKENFFMKALMICLKSKDSDAALKLHRLKDSMGNKYVMTSLKDEIYFLDKLLLVVSLVEPPDVTMKLYNEIVPYRMIANFRIVNVLECIDTFGEYDYVPKLWNDAGLSAEKQNLDVRILWKFLQIFEDKNHTAKLKETFSNITEAFLQSRLKAEKTSSDLDDGMLFRQSIKIFLNDNNLDRAWNALMKFYTLGCQGFISSQVLDEILNACVDHQDAGKIKSLGHIPENMHKEVGSCIAEILSQRGDDLKQMLSESDLTFLEQKFESSPI